MRIGRRRITRALHGESGVRVTVVSARELGQVELDRWASIAESDPRLSNPFLRPEFTLAVADVRDDVRVGMLERDDTLVGFFPFQVGRSGVGHPVGGAGRIVTESSPWLTSSGTPPDSSAPPACGGSSSAT